jgi:hypothetical protein
MEEVVDVGRYEPALTTGISDANFASIPVAVQNHGSRHRTSFLTLTTRPDPVAVSSRWLGRVWSVSVPLLAAGAFE